MNVDIFMAARLGHAVVLQSTAASTFPPLHGLVTAYFRITEKWSSAEPYLHKKGRDRQLLGIAPRDRQGEVIVRDRKEGIGEYG